MKNSADKENNSIRGLIEKFNKPNDENDVSLGEVKPSKFSRRLVSDNEQDKEGEEGESRLGVSKIGVSKKLSSEFINRMSESLSFGIKPHISPETPVFSGNSVAPTKPQAVGIKPHISPKPQEIDSKVVPTKLQAVDIKPHISPEIPVFSGNSVAPTKPQAIDSNSSVSYKYLGARPKTVGVKSSNLDTSTLNAKTIDSNLGARPKTGGVKSSHLDTSMPNVSLKERQDSKEVAVTDYSSATLDTTMESKGQVKPFLPSALYSKEVKEINQMLDFFPHSALGLLGGSMELIKKHNEDSLYKVERISNRTYLGGLLHGLHSINEKLGAEKLGTTEEESNELRHEMYELNIKYLTSAFGNLGDSKFFKHNELDSLCRKSLYPIFSSMDKGISESKEKYMEKLEKIRSEKEEKIVQHLKKVASITDELRNDCLKESHSYVNNVEDVFLNSYNKVFDNILKQMEGKFVSSVSSFVDTSVNNFAGKYEELIENLNHLVENEKRVSGEELDLITSRVDKILKNVKTISPPLVFDGVEVLKDFLESNKQKVFEGYSESFRELKESANSSLSLGKDAVKKEHQFGGKIVNGSDREFNSLLSAGVRDFDFILRSKLDFFKEHHDQPIEEMDFIISHCQSYNQHLGDSGVDSSINSSVASGKGLYTGSYADSDEDLDTGSDTGSYVDSDEDLDTGSDTDSYANLDTGLHTSPYVNLDTFLHTGSYADSDAGLNSALRHGFKEYKEYSVSNSRVQGLLCNYSNFRYIIKCLPEYREELSKILSKLKNNGTAFDEALKAIDISIDRSDGLVKVLFSEFKKNNLSKPPEGPLENIRQSKSLKEKIIKAINVAKGGEKNANLIKEYTKKEIREFLLSSEGKEFNFMSNHGFIGNLSSKSKAIVGKMSKRDTEKEDFISAAYIDRYHDIRSELLKNSKEGQFKLIDRYSKDENVTDLLESFFSDDKSFYEARRAIIFDVLDDSIAKGSGMRKATSNYSLYKSDLSTSEGEGVEVVYSKPIQREKRVKQVIAKHASAIKSDTEELNYVGLDFSHLKNDNSKNTLGAHQKPQVGLNQSAGAAIKSDAVDYMGLDFSHLKNDNSKKTPPKVDFKLPVSSRYTPSADLRNAGLSDHEAKSQNYENVQIITNAFIKREKNKRIARKKKKDGPDSNVRL